MNENYAANYTEKMLLGICEKLQLSSTLYEQATERYETIAKILQEADDFNGTSINIYPQGSFRLKTTVKPVNDEYDLDFVAELSQSSMMTPKDLYNNIYKVLKNDGIHNDMVEQKSRCIRVNYANDFHLDIMPGKLINPTTHEIIVPDKKLLRWYHHSNPIGFADWFETQARTRILNEVNQSIRSSFDVEKITEQEIARKLEPLRRAVQLVKRYRDIYCKKYQKEPVRSIVICTLMGKVTDYSGNTINIINRFCIYVNNLIKANNYRPFELKNPVVDEILTEKWFEDNNFQDFVDMMKELTNDINDLKIKKINSDSNEILKKMFGETITNHVITEYARSISAARQTDNLSVNSKGVLNITSTGIPVKKNTFFGGID